jgi:tetratricopeptide (TPR) repeat protein
MCIYVDTPAGISVYTPSNTGPQTPRAASSPPGTSTHNLATSLWQLDSAHILPTSNIISPPTVLSNPELFSAQPPSLEFLIIDHTSSSTDSGPPSPASPIPNIVHASTSGFMGQSPAPIHEDNPLDLLQESGSSQGIFQAHSIPPWSFSQPQLGQRISVQATPRYKQTEEDNLRGELSMRQTFYGAEHAETLTMLSKLAKVLLNQGRYRAAEEMTRKLLRVYSDGNKDNEIGRLKALHLLSDILYRQGNYSDTEKISLYTIQSRESLLGASHRDTVRSMTILALTYFALGRMTFAEELLVEIMETRKRYLGDEHRATLETLHYLGSTYSQMGRWNQAELLQTEALEIRRRVLGEEHINTLASMDALASTYRSQGLWSKAETLGAQTLKIMKRLLGEEHPNTLQSKMSLASTYYIQAKWLKAEEHQTQTLEIMKRVLGDEHPVTLNAMAQLANTWKSLDREDDAINLMVQSARLQLLKSGYSHPSTRFALGTLSHWGVPEFRIKTHSEFTDDNLRGTTPAEERHIVLETSTY